MPALSVILPAHNAQSTVGRAVSSVLRTLPADAELVVLNDGSHDRTGAILAEFAATHKRLRVLTHAEPVGVAQALNALIAATDSEVVARMDADDVSLPGRFTHQLRRLRSVDVSFTSIMTFGPGLAAWRPRPNFRLDGPFMAALLCLTNPVCHPTLALRRSTLERAGGYREVPAEDYDLWMRLHLEGARLERSSRVGLAYRLHPGQTSAAAGWKSSSWQNPQTQETYAQFTHAVTGTPLTRLTAKAIDPAVSHDELERVIADFSAVLETMVTQLKPTQRIFTRRVLRQRISNAWAIRRSL